MLFEETQSLVESDKVRYIILGVWLLVNVSLYPFIKDEASVGQIVLLTNGVLILIIGLLLLLKMKIRVTLERQLLVSLHVVVTVKTYRFELDSDRQILYPRINPIADFGGWGYRLTVNGDVGLIFVGNTAAKIDKLYFTVKDVPAFKKAVGNSINGEKQNTES